MAIEEHPGLGRILICNFDQGFREPEMVKRRPVVVISPKISFRPGLCTVVPLSTARPRFELKYHCEITLDPPLPAPFDANQCWVKGDMICAVGFHRLDLVRVGKDETGKRRYRHEAIPDQDLIRIRKCVLTSLGLASLQTHLD